MKRCINIFLSAVLLLSLFSCSPAPQQPLSFAFLADTHIGTAIGADDLRNSVRDINRLENIEFVILAGDATEYDLAGELDTVKAIMNELKVPYHIIPGNHELKWSASGGEKFRKLFGDDKFHVQYKGFHFIAVNQGPLMRMGEGFIAREDLNWTKKQLAKIRPKNRPVFIVTHYPIDHTVTNSYDFLEIIKHYNVQAIIHGHGHGNRLNDYSDIRGIMGRSNLSRGGPGGYNIVSIERDSIFWRERRPQEKETLKPWVSIPLIKNVYTDSHLELKPDMSVNAEYPGIRESWSFDSEYAITAAAALSGNKVLFGNRSGKVYALSLDRGSVIWTFETGAPVFTQPEISGDRVYVSSTDSLLYCLDLESGKKIWSYRTNAAIVAHPRTHNGKVYFGAGDGMFRALDAESGKLIWDFGKISTYVESKPLIADGKVIFGAWDTYLYALNAENGRMEWRWRGSNTGLLYSPAVVHPVYANGKVFIVAPDRVMTAIDIGTGNTVWRSDLFKVRENIGISEDGSRVYAKNMWDIVCAVSTEGNEPETVWSTAANYGFEIDPSWPVEYGENVYFSTQFGYVFCLDAEDGGIEWKHRLGANLLNTPVLLNDAMIVTGMDGRIVKLTF
ncbi:MAG: PQQ-binding-like beta-propeller repeat protein [Candidatus Neomarinimicrobiota bacterium]|jgi:outer membrane protein assembly factor BamB/predicted phosphohydrolase|nr:PQQ-binding-like beta-propeller repeat protein [Candidatus Neomarinimicrobiota bacterium]MDX9780555.1 PQQ-binding-like beta-propeller repeat protein [bacterium]